MPKPGRSREIPIKDFAGLNLLDAADKVADNEFVKLQNVYQSSKGIFQARFGSTSDVSAADIPLCSRISGVAKHRSPNGENFSLYHCVPDASQFPDNTDDLVLTQVSDGLGDLFAGGAVVTLRLCYSWIGCGIEQTYNSRNRAGFPAFGSFPIDAWANAGHQTITMSSNVGTLYATPPLFPSGVRGANIFMARGNATQMTYVGTVTTSGAALMIRSYIAPVAALADAVLPVNCFGTYDAAGTLTPGNYYVSLGWVTNPNVQEGTAGGTVASIGLLNPDGPATSVYDPKFGCSVVTSPIAGGSLVNATSYDVVLAIKDPVQGYVYVTPTITVSTGATDEILAAALAPLPPGCSPDSTYDVFIAQHSGTMYKQNTAPLNPRTVYLILTQANSGEVAPNPKTPSSSGYFSKLVTLTGRMNAITVVGQGGASANGGRSTYVFIGTQDPTTHPSTCAGLLPLITIGIGAMTITSIPSHNAQSLPIMQKAEASQPSFQHSVNSSQIGGMSQSAVSRFLGRYGFLMAKKQGGSIKEIFPSRTLEIATDVYQFVNVFSGEKIDSNSPSQLHNFSPWIKTGNDLNHAPAAATGTPAAYSQPYDWEDTALDPNFCYHLGKTYFANGLDIPWQTDGYTMGQLSAVSTPLASGAVGSTLLPPIPKFLFEFQQSLVAAGGKAGNQLYQSNANSPQNWATGGVGTLLRFVTIGDASGSGTTAIGIFTPATEATDNPNSFMIAFKKNGTWMINSVPDPSPSALAGNLFYQSASTLTQVSGRTGCVAYRTVVQTPLGTVFLGTSGNVYLINRVAEPVKIGNKIQALLAHLSEDDALMQKCTAVFHDNHYKLSYPSAAACLLSPVVNDSELWADLRTEGGRKGIIWVGPHAGRAIGSQTVSVGDGQDLTRLVADDSAVRTMIADDISTLQDLGVAITKKIQGKIHRFNEDAHVKRVFGAEMDAYIDDSYTNQVLMEFFADEYYDQVDRILTTGGAVWDVSDWDQQNYADAYWQMFSFLLGGSNLSGRTVQWQLTHSNSSPFLLAGITLLLKAEQRRVIK